jgi:hypothetical protein
MSEQRPEGAGYDIGADELHVATCYLPMITKNYR